MLGKRVKCVGIAVVAVGLLVIVSSWAGVWRFTRPSPTSSPSRLIHDLAGRAVRIPLEPTRVLSLCTCVTDTLIRLGKKQSLVAMDEYSRIIPGTEGIPMIGKGSALSSEQIIASRIDLAFAWWYQDDVAALFDRLSVPCVRVHDPRIEQVNGLIRFVGECMNCPAEAEQLIENLPSPATQPADGTQQTVYLEMYGPYKTIGQDCYANDLLLQAGLSNIVTEHRGGLLLSAEQLIQADPDVILFVNEFGSAEAISQRPGLGELRAVQTGRVYGIDRGWLVAGAGWPRAVQNIRQRLSETTN